MSVSFKQGEEEKRLTSKAEKKHSFLTLGKKNEIGRAYKNPLNDFNFFVFKRRKYVLFHAIFGTYIR